MEVWSDGPLIELVSETACLHSEVDRHTAYAFSQFSFDTFRVLQSFDTKLSIVGKGQTETPDLTGHDFARSKSSQLEQTIRERALEHKMITTQVHILIVIDDVYHILSLSSFLVFWLLVDGILC